MPSDVRERIAEHHHGDVSCDRIEFSQILPRVHSNFSLILGIAFAMSVSFSLLDLLNIWLFMDWLPYCFMEHIYITFNNNYEVSLPNDFGFSIFSYFPLQPRPSNSAAESELSSISRLPVCFDSSALFELHTNFILTVLSSLLSSCFSVVITQWCSTRLSSNLKSPFGTIIWKQLYGGSFYIWFLIDKDKIEIIIKSAKMYCDVKDAIRKWCN